MTTVREHIQGYDGKWAGDANHPLKVGDVGFLLELSPVSNNPQAAPRRRLELRQHPVRKTGTLEEILFGTIFGDRTDVEALGVARVTEVAPNGRGRVQTIWGAEAATVLDQLAYPDLERDLQDQDEEYELPVYSDG